MQHVEKKLCVKVGESTTDKKFFLKDEIECLAACNGAPMMQVNHRNYENLTIEKVDEILDKIKWTQDYVLKHLMIKILLL